MQTHAANASQARAPLHIAAPHRHGPQRLAHALNEPARPRHPPGQICRIQGYARVKDALGFSGPQKATTTPRADIESSGVKAPLSCAFEPHTTAIGDLGVLHERILCHWSYAVRPDRDRGSRARCRRKHEQCPGHKCGFAAHSPSSRLECPFHAGWTHVAPSRVN
jgi:hypothetical protein